MRNIYAAQSFIKQKQASVFITLLQIVIPTRKKLLFWVIISYLADYVLLIIQQLRQTINISNPIESDRKADTPPNMLLLVSISPSSGSRERGREAYFG